MSYFGGGTSTPWWSVPIPARKILLLGLSTERFRDAPNSSHEVYVSPTQLSWFEEQIASHPASQGWRTVVFTHAPILGSGLTVLQDVHLRNGCAYVNHGGDIEDARRFVEIVDSQDSSIRLWLSGHFHLSHDYVDSVSYRPPPSSHPDLEDGLGCLFAQCGVIGSGSSRDGLRQSRIVEVWEDGIEIFSVNHHLSSGDDGDFFDDRFLRHDCTYDLSSTPTGNPLATHYTPISNTPHFFKTYTPRVDDGCYSKSDGDLVVSNPEEAVCWWHVGDKILGVHDGVMLEYDSLTLAPLGIVDVDIKGKEIVVVENGTVVILVGEDEDDMEVVQPNSDGSYWSRFQGNKIERLKQAAREEVKRRFARKRFGERRD